MLNEPISILFQNNSSEGFTAMSETVCHDLALDMICRRLTANETEQKLIMNIMSKLTPDAASAKFRGDVFDDIMRFPKMRGELTALLDRIQFLKDYGTFKRDLDPKPGIWSLMHRMDEIKDFIDCIEAIKKCLTDTPVKSEGLIRLREYVGKIYEDAYFAEMKKDIEGLKVSASDVRSLTIGINLNGRFEATGLGLISVNDKYFKSSNVVSNFAQALAAKDGIRKGSEWNGDMHYHEASGKQSGYPGLVEGIATFQTFSSNPIIAASQSSTVANVPERDSSANIPDLVDSEVTGMLSVLVKKLRDVLSKYVTVGIYYITALIPEFTYYIRWAEFIEKLMEKKLPFCKAEVIEDENAGCRMKAVGLFNLKLLAGNEGRVAVVLNDLDFTAEHNAYILTGANRGGKTTITQAVGLLYVLAQGGIYVPCRSFSFVPVDCVYTHFPADEDKTIDLGRLGEECTRFRQIFSVCTEKSLVLLNETFSTTSFEEGLYIARDSVRAMLKKGPRMIYNTHMHKLAADIGELNAESPRWRAASLVAGSGEGERSFRITVAEPQGMSYARDIAEKYGVTYEMLTATDGKEN